MYDDIIIILGVNRSFKIPSLLHLGCLDVFSLKPLYESPLGVNVNKKRWKDPAFFMGKLTISMVKWPFSIANCNKLPGGNQQHPWMNQPKRGFQ